MPDTISQRHRDAADEFFAGRQLGAEGVRRLERIIAASEARFLARMVETTEALKGLLGIIKDDDILDSAQAGQAYAAISANREFIA